MPVIDCFPDAPPEWQRHVIGEIAKVNPRYRLDKTKEYPFVEMAAVSENFGGIIRFDLHKADSSGFAHFQLNDILFGKITPCAENGKIALVRNIPDEIGLGSTEFVVLSPEDGHDPRFVYALACSNPVWGRAISRMEGSTGRQRITEDTFTKWLMVPVPPPEEQQEIARILDAVDAALDRTRIAIDQARRLKRGLIQRYFEGVGSLPVKLGTFITDIRYGTSQASNEKKWGYPTLRIPNIIGRVVDTNDLTYVDAGTSDVDRFSLNFGDLLIVRTNGNPQYVGRSAVFFPPDEKRWLFASYLIRVRFGAGILPRFVDEYFNFEKGRRELLRRVTTSAVNGKAIWYQ